MRRAAVPAPGGPEELAEAAGAVASRQLDRSRPLWEIHIIEGLEHGYVGVVAKMHHCTIDGVSGANMMVHLFDLSPQGDEKPPPDANWTPERKPSDLELVGYAVNSRLRRRLAIPRVLTSAVRAGINVVAQRRNPETPAGGTPLTAPRTSFNASVTPHRKVAFMSVPLAEIKEIKNAFGTTVNDVVLAICTGALRRYLQQAEELPEKSLVATCPVSVRKIGR